MPEAIKNYKLYFLAKCTKFEAFRARMTFVEV
jgi:hypothetical protein